MKTIETTLFLKDDHPFLKLCNSKKESVLAFDIETTGFSTSGSCLYLIGMVIKTQENFRLIQLFGESFSDEPMLLSQFFSICKEFDTLLSFNGDGFDIPYLRNCCQQYGMHFPLDNMKSVDIYKEIRPFKKLFPGQGLNQKALESLLCIPRKDVFSGGELIEVYEKYQKTQDPKLRSLLLLHNFEDLTGLLSLTRLLAYRAVFEGNFRLLSQWREKRGEGEFFFVSYQINDRFPIPFFLSGDDMSLMGEDDRLTLLLSLYSGTAKHFFPNYRDYYYLPREDTAVHKSLGEFVEKASRIRAKASTAYIKKDTMYLPVHGIGKTTLFQRDYRDGRLLLPMEAWNPESMGEELITGWLCHLKLRKR